MSNPKEFFNKQKKNARKIFNNTKAVFCPYFHQKIFFNSNGFHHLRYSSRRERPRKEQLLKFNLLPLAINVIKKSGTIQEFRSDFVKTKEKSGNKKVVFWALIAICGANTGKSNIKIKVILRKIGNGNIIFWSVMPCGNLNHQRLYKAGIENE